MGGLRISVLALLLGAVLTTASSASHGGEVVVIRPTSGEVSITQGQRIRAMLFNNGWLSCSRRIDLDYRESAIIRLQLFRGGEMVQVVDKRHGRWETSRRDPHSMCLHVNSPYLSNWRFDYLWLGDVGDYELRWTRGASVQLPTAATGNSTVT